jgi:hypothetical protein
VTGRFFPGPVPSTMRSCGAFYWPIHPIIDEPALWSGFGFRNGNFIVTFFELGHTNDVEHAINLVQLSTQTSHTTTHL